jgi:hypothetical protein
MSKLDDLLQSCPATASVALRAKLHVIERERDNRSSNAYHMTRNAAAAGRRLGHSVTALQLWEGAEREADVAVGSMIDACLDVGVTDVDAIVKYVGGDLRQFLTSFATTRIQPDYGGVANELISKALAKQGQVKSRVIAMQFDRQQRSTQMAAMNVTVHGGNVQVGDGNTQTITYQNLLRAAARGIDGRTDVPADRRAALSAAFSEVADFPDIEAMMSMAAKAAGGR